MKIRGPIFAVFAACMATITWCYPGGAQEHGARKPSEPAIAFLIYRENARPPKTASFLQSSCQSEVPFVIAYCKGYIAGAMHLWRMRDTCASSNTVDLQFCAGTQSADQRVASFFEDCSTCDFESFRPNLVTEAQRFEAFWLRLKELPDEVKAALGACPQAGAELTAFCQGFEAEAANSVAELVVMYLADFTSDPDLLGRGDGMVDAGLHLWGDEEFFDLQTCLTHSTEVKDVQQGLLEFLESYPDQARVRSAVILLGRALKETFCSDVAESRPQMEACIDWSSDAGMFVARNKCETPVIIRFMAKVKPDEVELEVAPGELFRTGLSDADVRIAWWMFTACPVGHSPSVPFVANSQAIKASRYVCVLN